MLEELNDQNDGSQADGEPSDSEKVASKESDLSALVTPKSLKNEENKSNQSE